MITEEAVTGKKYWGGLICLTFITVRVFDLLLEKIWLAQ